MQRASSVNTVTVRHTGNLDGIGIMPNISSNWAGRTTGTGLGEYDGADFNPGFITVMREYQAKTPIQIPDAPPCHKCSMSIPVSIILFNIGVTLADLLDIYAYLLNHRHSVLTSSTAQPRTSHTT